MREARILYCEDYRLLRESVSAHLTERVPEYRVVAEAPSVAKAHEYLLAFSQKAIDLNVLLLDGELKDGSAMDVVEHMKRLNIHLPIIGLSGSINGLKGQGLIVGKDLIADIPKANSDLLKDLVLALQSIPEPTDS